MFEPETIGDCPVCSKPLNEWKLAGSSVRFRPCDCVAELGDVATDRNGKFVGGSHDATKKLPIIHRGSGKEASSQTPIANSDDEATTAK